MGTPRKKPGKKSKKALKSAQPRMLIIPEWTGTIQTNFGPVTATVPQREVPLPPCPCCEACDALETGKWGTPWRDAAGEYQCSPGPTTGTKVHKGDGTGPAWVNE